MKYWVSHWATEHGIIEIEANPIDAISALKEMENDFLIGSGIEKSKFIKITKSQHNGLYKVGTCCLCDAECGVHETESAARSAAEEMRTKKIASLRKQIERLERMEF